jgi:hypothetical protein
MPYSDAQRRMAKAYGVNVEHLEEAIAASEARAAGRAEHLAEIRQRHRESIAGRLEEAAEQRTD